MIGQQANGSPSMGDGVSGFDEVVAELAPYSLLRTLAPNQIETLLQRAQSRTLGSGDVIINQGDAEGDFAVLVLSGGLKIAMVSATGREIILNYCGPGELLGEIALLDSGPRTASVSAVEPSKVLLISSRIFLDIVAATPESMVSVLRELARRVRELDLVVESDRTFSMAPRLARALVRLIDEDNDDGRLRYNPSQGDLGAFAGLARENVSRLLAEWEEHGVIARRGRALLVRDADYLQMLAEFGDEA
ncbi:MAG: Crp/Fnr family transcriptional regulator [Pseudomonadota bacterium]